MHTKKTGKVLMIVFMVCLLAVSAFWVWDYSKNPQKYDALMDSFKGIVQGESQFETETVSPLCEISMSSSPGDLIPEYRYAFQVDAFSFPEYPGALILCYGKDIGGDLYFPMARAAGVTAELKQLRLFAPGQPIADLTEFAVAAPEQQLVTLSEEALAPLAPGEYFLMVDFQISDGSLWKNSIGLIVSETTTRNSLQRGIINQADDSNWILNDLQNPRDITFTFVNLGDNPVRYVTLNHKDIGPDAYRINQQGNQVTLTKEYLATLPLHSGIVFTFRLANGDTMETLDRVVGTVDGDSLHRVKFLPESDICSLSAGGDYLVPLDIGDASRIVLVKLEDFGSNNPPIFEDNPPAHGLSRSYNADTHTVIIPEEILQGLKPQEAPYCISVGYILNTGLFMQDSLLFHITE